MPDTAPVSEDAHTAHSRRRSPASKRWTPTTDPQPTDPVPVHLPRAVRELVERERDRLDPPTDGLGRKRPQQSLSAFTERLVRRGLVWARTMPDWSDPLAVDDEAVSA